MRTLVVTTFVTMDGVMQAPGGPGEDPSGGFSYEGWLVPHFDEAVGEQIDRVVHRRAGLPARPHDLRDLLRLLAEDDQRRPGLPGAQLQEEVRRLAHADARWSGRPRSCCRATSADAVRKLKAEDGGELQVHGSAGLIQTLLAEDLVDELRLIVFPVLLGSGKRLFGDGTVPRTWRLAAPEDVVDRRADAELRARRRGRDRLGRPRVRLRTPRRAGSAALCRYRRIRTRDRSRCAQRS